MMKIYAFDTIQEAVYWLNHGGVLNETNANYFLEHLLKSHLSQTTIAIISRNPKNEWYGINETLEFLLSK